MKRVKIEVTRNRFEYHSVASEVSNERFLQLCEKSVPLKVEVVEDEVPSFIRPLEFMDFVSMCWTLANKYEY